MSKLKIIATAYACEPNKGSEPGIGWNIVREAARKDEIWVITRENNGPAIEADLARSPEPNLHVVYFDLPKWARWWKRGPRGVLLYYYLWQIGAYRKARALHRQHQFDVAHHVTFGRYWNPSFLPGLHIPFVWGPVGGGESAPKAYWSAFGWKGRLYETLRDLARRVGEQDPFVRQTARHCKVGLPTTFETAARLRHLGVQELIEVGNAALNHQDIEALGRLPDPPNGPIRFVSMGRLLHWKGFHLGLQAFAAADLPEAEYWIIGDGSDRPRLESLACSLGIAGRVRFTGNVSRTEAMQLMAQCHALVHPSLHDSGGWVCIEALAAGRSVLCLDLGGPALLVNQENGFKVSAQDPEQSIRELVEAMQILAKDDVLRERMGKQARIQAAERFTWASKAEQIGDAYRKAVGDLSVSKSVSANRPSALIQTESTLLPVSTP